ncbi:MAG: sigma-70 family RNA polymerase sigma factor [Solirubrobacterales bacterium]|nr:sigma-70 family RNA polymerase sigma factor [Solirubrobacterales bacterium]
MEASALPAPAAVARTRPSLGTPLLRLRSDEQLVALFRAGHDEAFRVIHDRYRQRLFAYTRQMLPHRQDAEDAIQDIFVRAYAGLRANHRELALRAWLYRVAHNRCIDELRRPSPPPPEVMELLRSPVHDPIAQADQRESLRRLIADVRRLPDQQRSALLMRELGGMSYADLAGALGVTVPAVKSLLVRARLGLAQALEARDTACSDIREELILSHDRGLRPNATARRHMRDCDGCREFRHQLRGVSRRFAAIVPTLGPLGVLANVLGIGGAGSGAAGGAAAASAAAGSGCAAVGIGTVSAGATHMATLIAAAVVTAGGAVELQHTLPAAPVHHHHHARVVAVAAHRSVGTPATAPDPSLAVNPPAVSPPAIAAPSPVRVSPSPVGSGDAHTGVPSRTPASTPTTTTTVTTTKVPRSTGGISTAISAGGVSPSGRAHGKAAAPVKSTPASSQTPKAGAPTSASTTATASGVPSSPTTSSNQTSSATSPTPAAPSGTSTTGTDQSAGTAGTGSPTGTTTASPPPSQ